MTTGRPRIPLLLAASMLFACGNAAAGVDDNGLFEIDANAVDDTVGVAPDDWGTAPQPQGAAQQFTGIVPDVAPASIHGGGDKDILPLGSWTHKDGAVPDKDDITNAYAAAYDSNGAAAGGDLIVYFGADRVSNDGDAFLGFWFFKAAVSANPDGTFTGAHTNGDTLILVNFPQASNADPYIAVVTWDTTCTKAASNDPSPTECAAANLRLKSEGTGAGTNVCDSAKTACATTNSVEEASPWSYIPKPNVGSPGLFPFETFFEGGVNLTQLIGSDSCFSSFMAESRSASSFTAALKDFVLDDFELCSVDIEKVCTDSELKADESAFVFTYDITVTNDGFGGIFDAVVTDNNGTPGNAADDTETQVGDLAAGATYQFTLQIESQLNPPTNTATVAAAGTNGGQKTVTDSDTATCPAVDRDPRISVTKVCETEVNVVEGQVVVGVTFSGQVCNDTGTVDPDTGLLIPPLSLNNVTVVDDQGTPANINDDVTVKSIANLPAATCQSYSGSYTPGAVNSSLPSEVTFSDTVTATGTAPLGFGQVSEQHTATCPLCPVCEDCEP